MAEVRRPAGRRGWAVASAVVAASVTACGSVTSPGSTAAVSAGSPPGQAPAAEPGMTMFICPGTASALLLQWQDSNGALSGTYESSALSGQAPDERASLDSGDLSGTLNGTAVSLSIGLQQPLGRSTEPGSP